MNAGEEEEGPYVGDLSDLAAEIALRCIFFRHDQFFVAIRALIPDLGIFSSLQ